MYEAREETDDILGKMKFKSYLLKQIIDLKNKNKQKGEDWQQEEELKAWYEDAVAWHFVLCFGLKRGKFQFMKGIWLNGTLDSKGGI